MKDTKQAAELREKYKIPEEYHFDGVNWPNGTVQFDFCDSTITIYPDGKATESHMALNSDATRHEFKIRIWKPE